jgi:hypothetical protein
VLAVELAVAEVSLAVCPADGAAAEPLLAGAEAAPPLLFWSMLGFVVWATAIDPITSAAVAAAKTRDLSKVLLHEAPALPPA